MATILQRDYEQSQTLTPPIVQQRVPYLEKALGAAQLGAQESIVLSGAHAVFHAIEGRRAKKSGEEFITEEEVTAEFGEDFEFREGEYRGQTRLRAKYQENRDYAAFVSADMGLAGQFGWGVLGNTLLDVPAMLLPGATVSKTAQLSMSALKGAKNFRTVENMVVALDTFTKTPGLRKTAALAFIEQGLETEFVYQTSSYTGRDYGAYDRLVDMFLGYPIALGLSTPAVIKSKKVARQQARFISDVRAAEAFFQTGEYAQGLSRLRKYSEDLDLGIRDAEEIQAIIDKPMTERTAVENVRVHQFYRDYGQDLEVQSKPTDVDPDSPIIEQLNNPVAPRPRYTRKGQLFELEMLIKVLENPSYFEPEIVSDAKARFEQDFLRPYIDELTIAKAIVRDVFGIKAEVMMSYNIDSLGLYEQGSKKITVASIETFKELNGFGYITPAQVVFHEAIHALRDTDPTTWKALSDAIESQPMLLKKLNDLILDRGYSLEKLRAERPSVLMEWAVTQPEFWQALQSRDANLFDKFSQFIRRFFLEAKRLLGRNSDILDITEGDLQNLTPAQLAEKLGILFNELRQGARGSRRLTPAQINRAAKQLDETWAADNARAANSVAQREVFEAQSLVEEAKAPKSEPVTIHNVLKFIADNDFETRAEYESTEALDPLIWEGYPEELKEVFNKVLSHKLALNTIRESIDNYFGPKIPAAVRKNINTLSNYLYWDYQVKKGSIGADVARSKYLEGLESDLEAVFRRESANFNAILQFDHLLDYKSDSTSKKVVRKISKKEEQSRVRKALKYLKVYLDGRERRGVSTKQASLETKVLAQIQQDQSALRHALTHYGLYDLFTGVSTISVESVKSRDLHTVSSESGQAIYGKKLKEAHVVFWDDLLRAARNKKVPDDWKGVEAFEKVFEAYMATVDHQWNQLDVVGAGITKKQRFSGLSQRWDDGRLLRLGRGEWMKDMQDHIDWEATESAHGGFMPLQTNAEGVVQKLKPFNRQEFLEQWWDEIESHKRDVHSSEDIVKSFGKHRQIHLKEDSELLIAMKYSGHTSPGILFMDQVRHRSEMIAVATNLGTRPLPNFQIMMDRVGLDPTITLKKAVVNGQLVKGLNTKHLLDTVKHLTGALDNPVDINFAERGKALRRLSNVMFLPLSGISAITDIPMIALRLHQQGLMKFSDTPEFLSKYFAAHRRNFGSDKAMREYLEAMGAGLDASLNAAASRIAIGDPNNPSALSKANDVMFTINYLNGITRAGQEAYIDVVSQNMAKQFESGDVPDPLLITSLEQYGFTSSDVKILLGSITEAPDGVRRLSPADVSDAGVRRKLREYFLQNMNEAVMFPDVGSQSLLRMGTRAGTFGGEATRIALQYTSFPLAMTRIIMRKFMSTYDGKNPWTSHQTGMIQMCAFVGSMLAMGYMSTVVKDLIRGREPMSLARMTPKGWERVVAQSGVAGILELVFDAGSGNVRGVIAPLPGTVLKAAGDVPKGPTAVLDELRPAYGSTYPVVGPAAAKILGWFFGESLTQFQKQRNVALDTMYQTP